MLESTKITGVNRLYIPPQFRRACYRYRQPDIDIAQPAGPSRASSPCSPWVLSGAPSRGLVGPILQLSCAASARPSGSLDILDPGELPGDACSLGEYILLIYMSQFVAQSFVAQSFWLQAVNCPKTDSEPSPTSRKVLKSSAKADHSSFFAGWNIRSNGFL